MACEESKTAWLRISIAFTLEVSKLLLAYAKFDSAWANLFSTSCKLLTTKVLCALIKSDKKSRIKTLYKQYLQLQTYGFSIIRKFLTEATNKYINLIIKLK